MLQAYLPDCLARHAAAPGVGRPSRRAEGRRAHQGAGRQGRQPGHGAGRRRDPRLAAGHLGHQAGDRHQLQARPRLGVHARAHRRGAHRRRRTEPLRHRVRLAARRRAVGPRRHRVRDAARDGHRPHGRRPRRRRAAAALHAGRAPRRSSTSPSPTSCDDSRRTRAARTSCRRPSTSPSSTEAFEREAQRFLDSVKALDDSVPEPFRSQDRSTEHISLHTDGFVNTADTDPSTDANRQWGRLALARSTYTQLGMDTVAANRVHGPASMQTVDPPDPRGRSGLGGPRRRRAVVGAAPGRCGARLATRRPHRR